MNIRHMSNASCIELLQSERLRKNSMEIVE